MSLNSFNNSFRPSAVPFLEYGWVPANPTVAGQTLTDGAESILTLDTEVQDLGGFGSIGSNRVTLAAGTYYFKAFMRARQTAGVGIALTLSLYNQSDSTYVSRQGFAGFPGGGRVWAEIEGQFTITSTKSFELRAIAKSSSGSLIVDNGTTSVVHTDTTAGADQRTTIKLWKLA
jgi:hypothetical protein